MNTTHRRTRLAGPMLVIAMVLSACASSSGGGSAADGEPCPANGRADTVETIRVPKDHDTIQEAVCAAHIGDLVLVSPGIYREAVDVTTPYITIRGTNRNTVILDGGFKRENGVRVLGTDGVVVENMTARNFVSNGFFWTGSDYFRGSYLTAYRNGDYAIYAFDAYHGQFDHSYGGGSPDAGFYVGECFRCDTVIDHVVSENNGLGYSGTNSGGDLYILNSTFRNNRAGIVPNTGSYELCYPERESTIVGNLVYSNNNAEAPAIDIALLANGNGILVPGGVRNVIERNRVWDHQRTGIGLVPFPEEDASDLPPAKADWDAPCSETARPEGSEDPDRPVQGHRRPLEELRSALEPSGEPSDRQRGRGVGGGRPRRFRRRSVRHRRDGRHTGELPLRQHVHDQCPGRSRVPCAVRPRWQWRELGNRCARSPGPLHSARAGTAEGRVAHDAPAGEADEHAQGGNGAGRSIPRSDQA